MNLFFLFQNAPSPDDVQRLMLPIYRNGRENLSYLTTLDAGDLTVIILYFSLLGLLAIFGLYRLRMVYHFWRYKDVKPQPLRKFAEDELPRITVQLPLFNELYVVERLLKSVAALDYPRELLQVQVLDDSTDETTEIAANRSEDVVRNAEM